MERARGKGFAQGNPQTRDIPVTQAPEVAVDMAVVAVPDANPIPPDGRSGGKGGGAENHVHPPMVMCPPLFFIRQDHP